MDILKKYLKNIVPEAFWILNEIIVLLIFNTIFYFVVDNYFGWNPRGINWYDIALFSVIEAIFLKIWWYLIVIKKL